MELKEKITGDDALLALAGWLKIGGVIVVGLVVLRVFAIQPYFVDGESMVPNFRDGDLVLAEKISYRFFDPLRGHIVLFKQPGNPKKTLLKRVVGLPEERVLIESGKLFVYNNEYPQGAGLEEPYREIKFHDKLVDATLKEDEYYLIGDNSTASLDSRYLGPVKRSAVFGRVFLRILPLGQIGRF